MNGISRGCAQMPDKKLLILIRENPRLSAAN